MSSHLTSVTISNFKRFKELKVENIGQFNLIVGDNNVGKSSFLEALLFNESVERWMVNLIFVLTGYRGYALESFNDRNYFANFLNDRAGPNIKIAVTYTDQRKDDLELIVSDTNSLTSDELEEINLQNIGRLPSKHTVSLIKNGVVEEMKYLTNEVVNVDQYVPMISDNVTFGIDLIKYFSRVQQKKSTKDALIEDLKVLIPAIEDVEISNSEGFFTFMISETEHDEKKIINQFGEGSIKLFRLLLELNISANGRLMIDEIGSGIYYSRMVDFYKTLLKSAVRNNVQVFATTHSQENIQAFKEAVESLDLRGEARLIKLSDTLSGTKAYTSNYDQIDQAVENESELR